MDSAWSKENNKIKRQTIAVFFGISIALVNILLKGPSSDYNQIIGILGLLIIAWCVISIRIKHKRFLVLVLLFELSYYILTSGQSFLYALNIPLQSTLDLYLSEPTIDVNTAYIYNYLCLMMFHVGLLSEMTKKYRLILGKTIKSEEKHDYTATMQTIGWIIFLFSVIPYFMGRRSLYVAYSNLGYRAAYLNTGGTTSWAKITKMIGPYYVYSVFLLLVSYKDDKIKRSFFTGIVMFISLLNFMVGNRSEPICYMFALFWFKGKYPTTDSGKKLTSIMLVIFIVSLFIVIPIIGATRNNGTLSIETILDSLVGTESALNMVKDTFIGLGWSAFPLIKTMQLIPNSISYHYGESYFFALLSVFPNLVGGTHISVKYAGLPAWLMNTLKMTYGPGFSMPAEAYYNFGWFGIIVFALLGRIISRLLREDIDDKNLLSVFSKIGLFIVLFSVPRREMLTSIRNSVYDIGFIYVAVKILYNYNKKTWKRVDNNI